MMDEKAECGVKKCEGSARFIVDGQEAAVKGERKEDARDMSER
jgi:uncharacterized Zn-binding protein involved in type VI secretion